MSERPDDQPIDATPAAGGTGPSEDAPAGDAAPPEGETIELELHRPGEAPGRCPACDAALPEPGATFCLRCGYDLVTGRTYGSAEERAAEAEAVAADEARSTDEPSADDEPSAAPQAGGHDHDPIVRPGRVDARVALAIALVVTLGLLAAQVGGVSTVVEEDDAVGRLVAVLRTLILLPMSTALAWVAVLFFAHLTGRPVGPVRTGIARLLALVCVVRLASFIGLPHQSLEWTAEIIVQAGLFYVGQRLILDLGWRESFDVLLVVIGNHLVLTVAAAALLFVYGF